MRIVHGHRIVKKPRFFFPWTEVSYFDCEAAAYNATLFAWYVACQSRVLCQSSCYRILPCLRSTSRKLPLLKRWYNSIYWFIGNDEEVLIVCEDAVVIRHDPGPIGLLCDEIAVKGIVGHNLAGCKRGQVMYAPQSSRRGALNARQREEPIEWCIVARVTKCDGTSGEGRS